MTKRMKTFSVEMGRSEKVKLGEAQTFRVVEDRTGVTVRWFFSERSAVEYAAYMNSGGRADCTPKGVCRAN